MSAFTVNTDLIDLLVTVFERMATPTLGPGTEFDGTGQGADLLAENYASVNYRYSEETPVPEYMYRPVLTLPAIPDMTGWHWVQIQSAVGCYVYQSCEHPGWAESRARKLVTLIDEAADHMLKGMDWPKTGGYGQTPRWEGLDQCSGDWMRRDGWPSPPEPAPRAVPAGQPDIPARDVAKLVRAELKDKFPGIKFSVRTEHGSTLNITWTDGPADSTVSAVVDKYAGQDFDGMQDMRIYLNNGYGTDFVFTHRNLSPEREAELVAELVADLKEHYGYEWNGTHSYLPHTPQVVMRETERGYDDGSMYTYVRILDNARAVAADNARGWVSHE